MIRGLTSEQKNTLLGFLPIAIWAFSALLAVELSFIPIFELLFFLFTVGFCFVFVRYLTSKDKKEFLNFRKKDLLVTSIFLAANQVCYFVAFRYSPAAQVDLINFLWPTLLVFFFSFLPGEKKSISHIIACFVSFFGIYQLLSPDFKHSFVYENFIGYLLAFGSALTWTAYSLYTRHNKNITTNCTSWACGPLAILAIIFHFYTEKFVVPDFSGMLLIILAGILQMGFAVLLWGRALKKGCVKSLGVMSYTIPIFSIMVLILFGKADFNERMITTAILISISPLIPRVKNNFSSILNRIHYLLLLKKYQKSKSFVFYFFLSPFFSLQII